jgi:ribosomal protein S6
MKNRYEALIVLNTKGNDDTIKEIIERLEVEFNKEGAKIESVQKMDRRQFSYAAGHLDSGYFVNFIFEAEPILIDKLRAKFKLDADVYRQNYRKLASKKAAAAA